ncbi:MAG: hypothetical protein V5A84_04050 [Planctomycetota bacterium]
MDLREAGEVAGLKAGREYTAEEVSEALAEADRRWGWKRRYAVTIDAREGAKSALSRVRMARQVLHDHMQGGRVYIPASPTSPVQPSGGSKGSSSVAPQGITSGGGSSSGSSGSRKRKSSTRQNTGSGGSRSGLSFPSPPSIPAGDIWTAIRSFCDRFGSAVAAGYRSQTRQTITTGLWSLLKGLGGLLAAPVQLALDREIFKSAMVALLIGAMVTGIFIALTGDLRTLTPVVRNVCRDVHRFAVTLIVGEDALPAPERESVTLTIDGREAQGKTTVKAGTHRVTLRHDGRTLHSGEILLPEGGTVRLTPGWGDRRKLLIEWEGERKWLAKTR